MITHSRLALALLGTSLLLIGGESVQAAPPVAIHTMPAYRPTVPTVVNPVRPIGADWWRTYPWSQYNAWRNPYWYPPYNPNYPYPPTQAYPYYPVPMPTPVYPYPIPGSSISGMPH